MRSPPPVGVCVQQLAGYNTRVSALTAAPKTRREILEGFVTANPHDAFARFGLAIECAKTGDSETAISHFRQLLATHPNYVVGYFQLGQLLARLARTQEAKEVLTAGITVAQSRGDQHARDEMEAFLKELAK